MVLHAVPPPSWGALAPENAAKSCRRPVDVTAPEPLSTCGARPAEADQLIDLDIELIDQPGISFIVKNNEFTVRSPPPRPRDRTT